jgi:hypothetical protein
LPCRLDRLIDSSQKPASIRFVDTDHPIFRHMGRLGFSSRGKVVDHLEQGDADSSSQLITQYTKLDVSLATSANTVCKLNTGDPFLVEREMGRGRVLVCATSFDKDSRFVRLPEFVRQMHEIVYALAGTRITERNIVSGQSISFSPNPIEPAAGVTVQFPGLAPKIIPVNSWPLVISDTSIPGIYTLTTAAGQTSYFAVRGDPKELVDNRLKESDKEAMSKLGSIAWIDDPSEARTRDLKTPVMGNVKSSVSIWWLVLLGLLGLMLVEMLWSKTKSE